MMLGIKNREASVQPPSTSISLRCPQCKHMGTFEVRVPNMMDLALRIGPVMAYSLGQRFCANPDCQGHIFFVYDIQKKKVAVSYPAERIDFDSTKIPQPVVAALEEAITCHANQCFVAAAIMVRKTLEELCADRSAKGSSLKDRIKALGKTVVLPADLLDGLDELRLLGNDAAHIESQIYAKVDQEEVDVAIDVTKEVLKAVYQYSSLVDRLRALKKQP